MNEIVENDGQNIKKLIYEIRGKQVMLDADLALLYGCKGGTKEINQAVRNNPQKFPERYCFVLSPQEASNLRSKFFTANINSKSRVNPRVFTEQGIMMLATILKSDVATEATIRIMDTFTLMRKYISSNLLEQKYVNELVFKDHDRIKLLENSFRHIEEKRKDSMIFFDGQFFDAYSKICDIFKEAKESLIIIDSYSDRETLKVIKELAIPVTIITSSKSSLSEQDIEKYNKQYNNLKVIIDNTFHDRYFLLDNEIVYCCGTSLNYLGHKTFSVIKVSDKNIIESLKEKITDIIG